MTIAVKITATGNVCEHIAAHDSIGILEPTR